MDSPKTARRRVGQKTRVACSIALAALPAAVGGLLLYRAHTRPTVAPEDRVDPEGEDEPGQPFTPSFAGPEPRSNFLDVFSFVPDSGRGHFQALTTIRRLRSGGSWRTVFSGFIDPRQQAGTLPNGAATIHVPAGQDATLEIEEYCYDWDPGVGNISIRHTDWVRVVRRFTLSAAEPGTAPVVRSTLVRSENTKPNAVTNAICKVFQQRTWTFQPTSRPAAPATAP
jgi:hypothetical protein